MPRGPAPVAGAVKEARHSVSDSKKKRYHRSSQREAILTLVRRLKTHPTAEEIYAQLRPSNPRLSLGTVYRNLHILAQQGEIREIHFGSGRDRFDGNTNDHYHFICRRCEDIIDLATPIRSELMADAEAALGRPVDSHTVQFFGYCERCR